MITKTDAIAKLNAKDEQAFKALVERIDELLLRYEGRPVILELGSESDKVVRRIIEAYSEAGWTVTKKQSHDPREPGYYLEFT